MSTAKHCTAHVQELLYCNERSEDAADHPTTGRVSFVFEGPNGTDIRFTRAIVGSGSEEIRKFSSKFDIDGEDVSRAEFSTRLLALGINTKARNFLVFQVRAPALPGTAGSVWLLGCITMPTHASQDWAHLKPLRKLAHSHSCTFTLADLVTSVKQHAFAIQLAQLRTNQNTSVCSKVLSRAG